MEHILTGRDSCLLSLVAWFEKTIKTVKLTAKITPPNEAQTKEATAEELYICVIDGEVTCHYIRGLEFNQTWSSENP